MKNGIITLDPRVKLVLFFLTCIFVIKTTQIIYNFLLGTLIVVLLFCSNKRPQVFFSYFLFLLGLFMGPLLGNRMGGILAVVIMAMGVLIRMMLPISMAFLLVYQTTTISEFIAAFQKMRIPVRIIIPLAVMFRFLPTLQEEFYSIKAAMAFRGISLTFRRILRHPINTLEYVLIPLLLSAVNIMDELAAASMARGLDSDNSRTCLAEVKMTLPDYAVLAAILYFARICFG